MLSLSRRAHDILTIGLVGIGVVALTSTGNAANRTRQYDFEGGVAGQPTTTLTDSIDSAFFSPVPATDLPGLSWIEVAGNAPRPLPAAGLQDSVDSVVLLAPSLNAEAGAATYVDISSGSGLELPETAVTPSQIALRLDGATRFNDVDPDTGRGGSRGIFFSDEAYDNNAPIEDSVNVFESFTLLSQAWVRPDSSAAGARQIVYQIGEEQGAVTITPGGKWQVDNLGIAGPIVTGIDVAFDRWSHVAVLRGGGTAEFYLNGKLQGSGGGFFTSFADRIVLGAGDSGEAAFTGLVDNFVINGFGDLTFDPSADLDIVPEPTAVALALLALLTASVNPRA